jgi:hypothetical protein
MEGNTCLNRPTICTDCTTPLFNIEAITCFGSSPAIIRELPDDGRATAETCSSQYVEQRSGTVSEFCWSLEIRLIMDDINQ